MHFEKSHAVPDRRRNLYPAGDGLPRPVALDNVPAGRCVFYCLGLHQPVSAMGDAAAGPDADWGGDHYGAGTADRMDCQYKTWVACLGLFPSAAQFLWADLHSSQHRVAFSFGGRHCPGRCTSMAVVWRGQAEIPAILTDEVNGLDGIASTAQAIWGLLVLVGAPSAVFGLLFHRFEKRMEKRDQAQEVREKAREKNEVLIVRSVGASVALGEAVALALKNGKCNGETEAALEYARKVKHEQKDFLTEQGIRNLY